MRVSVITSLNYRAYQTTFPLYSFRRQIKALGIHLKFFRSPDAPGVTDCDVICIIRWNFKTHFPPYGKLDRDQIFAKFRDADCALMWIDDHDSTGKLSENIISLVDLYVKNQLLRDRTLYTKALYQKVYFRDYYHRRNGIIDKDGQVDDGIRQEDLSKLALGWNLSMMDWRLLGRQRIERVIGYLLPVRRYVIDFQAPNLPTRPLHVSYRVVLHERADTISHQRKQAFELLQELDKADRYRLQYKGSVPFRQYRQELRQSMVIVSPFGWGEVCFRDFEAIEAGAVILKPEMSGVETYPHVYEENVTYIPYSWDHEDFTEKLIAVLEQPQRYVDVAREAQERLRRVLQDGQEFSERFSGLVNQAYANHRSKGCTAELLQQDDGLGE